ncbi:MAG: septal ring lytic transglycosylase RlpA family protein [Sphingomonadaceae bacterium]
MRVRAHRPLLPLLLAMLLAACGALPKLEPAPAVVHPPKPVPARPGNQPEAGRAAAPALPAAGSGRGGYYQDDGPGENPPANLEQVPDADVRNDPLLPYSNRPYVVFGKTYTPITDTRPYTQIGIGSWYGKKFHGQRTSSGELYDMYKMTAAHPTLPIPSYARLTNLVSGAQVVVRINDRGPFHASRAIDVSYTAALKLGLLGKGSHELQIERILPDEIDRMLATRAGVSATTPARLQTRAAKPVQELSAANALAQSSSLSVAPPLVLAPKALASSAPQDMETLMQGERAAAASTAAVPGGYYLQLGAYSRAENAEAARARLARIKGVGELEVAQGGSVFRVFSGPYPSRQEALQAAQGLPSGMSLKPIVIQR